ncbi:interaptin-like isoform X3 [Macadamia integrifolia]|uniref:interaptin-like isoform X3 n=1 Tax=Macadamia integrifolia TaxID=60698 RepID=UPI001C4E9841|nr:interaptin-like isoform X3 [Macadamia integrifolia]
MVENINTRFTVSTFIKQVEKLSNGQKNAIKKTGLGHLLIMPNQKLSKTLLAELMDRWNCEKKAFVLPPGDIKISLMDVALILGLHVMGEPVVLKNDEPFSHLEREYGAVPGKREISISAIEKSLESFKTIVNDDFIRTFLLFTFGVLLFPNAKGTVDSRYLSFMEDLDKMLGYAWGAAVHENLHLWLDRRKKQGIEYVGGCLIFVQMWCYAHIDIARPLHHGRNLPFPRSCQWKNSSSHTRQWFTEKFEKLHENQIIWELNPTPEESQIDIVRELLEMPKETVESPSTSEYLSRTATDNDLRTQAVELEKELITDLAGEMADVQKYNMKLPSTLGSPSTNGMVDHLDSEEDTIIDVNGETSEVQKDTVEVTQVSQSPSGDDTVIDANGKTSEDTVIDVNGEIAEVREVTVEVTQASPSPSADNMDDVDNLRTTNEMLEKQVSEMEEVIEELRRENLQRNQMSEKQVSEKEEVIEELRRENQVMEKQISEMEGVIEELRRENQFLKSHYLSSNILANRLERIVFGEDLNDQKECTS